MAVELSANFTCLGEMPLGGRLLFRSRKDWRTAVISRKTEVDVTLSVASPKGRNYRILRRSDQQVSESKGIHYLPTEFQDEWIEHFAAYDTRW